MSVDTPFLAKFAKRTSDEEIHPNANDQDPRNGTYITRVARETTDDQ